MLNYGDIYELLEQNLPSETEALVHIEDGAAVSRITWGQLAKRSNNLAQAMIAAGAKPLDKVAFLTRNHPAYMEGLFAALKARLTHVNVNFRYVEEELFYIFDNSDATVVIYGSEFSDRIESLQKRLPKVRLWIENGTGPTLDFAQSYEALATDGDGAPLDIKREATDQWFLYTGGTTGMPKGVMWEHAGLWHAASRAFDAVDIKSAEEFVTKQLTEPKQRLIPACPMMHGTGLLTSMNAMLTGGAIVTLGGTRFDSIALWDATVTESVSNIAIVGDAFGKPMLEALNQNPGRWDLTPLTTIISSGVMWAPEVKDGLLTHHPEMMLVDTFGSSEGLGFGASITTKEAKPKVANFSIGEFAKVFTEDHREVQPGSDETGFVAISGAVPVGYYKDEAKTAKTFPIINGKRWSMPGDYCKVAEDGTLILMGRGSICINSAGEKIFPEEVEETLKLHPAVKDALVVGIPDPKWGQSVTGVVQYENGFEVAESELQTFCRSHLAAYKIPKHILSRPTLGRAVNGKADYKLITEYAESKLL